MNVVIHRNGVKINELAEKLIDRKVKKLEQMLAHFNPELVSLRLELNDIPRKGLFTARTVLALPGTALRAEKEGKDLPAVLSETFDRLFREVKKYKEFLRREPEYRRKRPGFKEKMMQVALPEEIEETFMEMVNRNMERLYNFALREVRNRIYQGLIKPGDISVPDVLDEAILQVSAQLPERLEEKWVVRELFRHIIRILNRVVQEKRVRVAPLEKRLQPDDIDTELYEYYQPDEVLRLEDVIPDPDAPTPDQVVESETVQRIIEHALAQLPNRWRQALTLMEFENFSPEEVAMIQNSTSEEVKREVEMAREFLKKKMEEYGLKWQT